MRLTISDTPTLLAISTVVSTTYRIHRDVDVGINIKTNTDIKKKELVFTAGNKVNNRNEKKLYLITCGLVFVMTLSTVPQASTK